MSVENPCKIRRFRTSAKINAMCNTHATFIFAACLLVKFSTHEAFLACTILTYSG